MSSGRHWGEVLKSLCLAALYHGVAVGDLGDPDLSYTPPVGRPWDAVQEVSLAREAGRVR